MKRLLFIALALAAPAYAQDSDGTVSPEQVIALRTYFACIYQQAAQVDDGVSDPVALTPRVAPTCRYLLGAAATLFAKGNQAERDAWYKKWLALEETQVTRTIWSVRVDRRASGESANPVTASALPDPAPAPTQLATAETATTRPAASRPRSTATPVTDGKPMSEWRRAYIARHGHEPPAAR